MSMPSLPPAIFLMGPTASGKTALAMELVSRLPVEIISVDATMVYRGLDIGSGKPTKAELSKAPHHLIDCRLPTEPYSAACFREEALELMENITERGKVPLLVGGTMLYFKALQNGLSPLPKADEAIRAEIAKEASRLGWPALHEKLKSVDLKAASVINPNDKQRIGRALEVYLLTGKPLFEHFGQSQTSQLDYQVLFLALVPRDGQRKMLHDKIEQRFDSMLANGLIEEVEALRARGDCHLGLPAIRSVGYRQVWQHLEGEISYAEMRDKAIAATRQLAKRQLTWLRSWPALHDFDFMAQDLKVKVMAKLRKMDIV